MLDTTWYTKYKEENPEEIVRVHTKDPEGFDTSE